MDFDFGAIDKQSLAIGVVVVVLLFKVTQSFTKRTTTRFHGPPATSLVFGVMGKLLNALDAGIYHDQWIREYGNVYEVPIFLWRKSLVVADPKALASFFSKDTATYHQLTSAKVFTKSVFGQSLLITEGADHKRQRRALSTAFSVAAIRRITPVFLDAVNQVKATWEAAIEASGKGFDIIEVQHWMNNIALDSVGIGGFSHDFGTLRGEKSAVSEAFSAFGNLKPSVWSFLALALSLLFFPSLMVNLPTQRMKMLRKVSSSVRGIAHDLINKAKEEGTTEKSIIGTLVKSETASSTIQMSAEEIMAQLNLLMLAGYETTAVSITYAFIELARHPQVQERLRAELSQFSGADATYEQLTSGLPYLDAVVSEVLRLRPAAPELFRQAEEDDILPLTEPVTDRYGNTIDSIFIAKGTIFRIPISSVNRLEDLWGADSKSFNPDRWLNENVSKEKAARISGWHHILTFADGPRACLGRAFALTEFKAVLSVLVRDFTFELAGGPDVKLELHRSLLPRPKIAGEEGPRVPLIVRKVSQ